MATPRRKPSLLDCSRKAEALWSDYQAMLGGKEIELDTDPGPLCGFCNHLTSCPRFEAEEVPHLAASVDELQELQSKREETQR